MIVALHSLSIMTASASRSVSENTCIKWSFEFAARSKDIEISADTNIIEMAKTVLASLTPESLRL